MDASMEARQWTSFNAQAWARIRCFKCARQAAVVHITWTVAARGFCVCVMTVPLHGLEHATLM